MHSKPGGQVGLQQHPRLRGELSWIWEAAWGLNLFVQTGLAQLQGGCCCSSHSACPKAVWGIQGPSGAGCFGRVRAEHRWDLSGAGPPADCLIA